MAKDCGRVCPRLNICTHLFARTCLFTQYFANQLICRSFCLGWTILAGQWIASKQPGYVSLSDSPQSPCDMSPSERLDEVARLLALGVLRLRARRRAEKVNDPNHLRRFGLDFTAEGSVGDTDAHTRDRAA
jgi:hypothetical protein